MKTKARRWLAAGATLGVAAVAMLGLGNQPAGTPQDLPEASAIFDRHIEALGGHDAVFAQKTRKIEGLYEGTPFTGTARLKVWAEAPNKLHMQIAQPLGMQLDLYYDGEVTWQQIDGVASPVFGARRVEIIEASDFYGEANYKDRYTKVETIGTAKLGDKEYYAVKATSQFGRDRRLFFDRQTGLFSAEQSPIVIEGADGKSKTVAMEIMISDYQAVAGTSTIYPRLQEQRIPGEAGGKVTMTFKDVQVDTGEKHDFSPPADVAQAFRDGMEKAEATGDKHGG
ncbi:MAG: hypothetical protein R3B49_09360 [Phycisphaerales bacterium]